MEKQLKPLEWQYLKDSDIFIAYTNIGYFYAISKKDKEFMVKKCIEEDFDDERLCIFSTIETAKNYAFEHYKQQIDSLYE